MGSLDQEQEFKNSMRRAMDVAYLDQCLPSKQKALGSILNTTETGCSRCNPSIWEVEVRESEVQDHPQQPIRFQAISRLQEAVYHHPLPTPSQNKSLGNTEPVRYFIFVNCDACLHVWHTRSLHFLWMREPNKHNAYSSPERCLPRAGPRGGHFPPLI